MRSQDIAAEMIPTGSHSFVLLGCFGVGVGRTQNYSHISSGRGR